MFEEGESPTLERRIIAIGCWNLPKGREEEGHIYHSAVVNYYYFQLYLKHSAVVNYCYF